MAGLSNTADRAGFEIRFTDIFDVPDIGHSERIDWRRIQLAIHFDQIGWANLVVKIRRKPGGRTVQDLFESSSFRGALDELFEDFIARVFPNYTDRDHKIHPVMNASSRGASENTGASPQMSFRLFNDLSMRLSALSSHQMAGLHVTARALAEIQRRKRLRS